MTKTRFTSDGVYTTKGKPVVKGGYNYLKPALDDNGQFQIVDCWPVNKEGEVHPMYKNSPIPVWVGKIGKIIKHILGDKS